MIRINSIFYRKDKSMDNNEKESKEVALDEAISGRTHPQPDADSRYFKKNKLQLDFSCPSIKCHAPISIRFE